MYIKQNNCKSCDFNGWDCKNCYVDTGFNTEDIKKPNILFTIMLTRQCNYRCDYCALTFSNDIIDYNTIDTFITTIKNKSDLLGNIKIEFFGGEPLLEFDKLKYIVNKIKNIDGISFSVVTNGELLDQNKLDFLNLNNFEIVFSVTLKTLKLLNNKIEFFKENNLNNIIINFIVEPGKELNMFLILKLLLKTGFRKITILPVYYTKIWGKRLKYLDLLLKKISKLHFDLKKSKYSFEVFYIRTNKEFEYNIKKNDYEFILDYNGVVYADYETELYLLNDIIPNNIFSYSDIYMGNILDKDFSLIDILIKRGEFNTIKYINKIINFLDIGDDLSGLGKIMKKNNVNL
ncbi:MAG: radical SAM protein [Candidatus Gracilibacteria bacterium]